MQKFLAFFIKRQNFSYLMVTALALAGLFSLVQIPKESSPEVRIPIGVVTTVLPGAAAEDVEQLISIPVEDQLTAGLEDLKKITSTSREGVSVVVAEFNANADIDKSIQAVKDEVDKVTDLPSDATEPNVTEVNFVDQPIFEFSLASDLPFTELITLAEDLEGELEKISGVSGVSLSGLRDRQVQVVVSREALDTYGIDVGTVVGAIARANQSLPVGGVTIDGIEYAIKLEGDIEDPTLIRDIPILSQGGTPLYVRDIAFVSDGVGPATTLSRVSIDDSDPRQGVGFAVFKKSGGDVTDVTSKLNKKLQELDSTLLKDADVLVTFDTGELVVEDLTRLSLSGFQTVILVFLVLLLTLGWRESIIAALAIPMSFLLAFIGLNASGNTINFVSLFSLILAVGILVDSAIVVTEGIHTKITSGMRRQQAALSALKELSWPVIAGTMTTVAVFFPLFFISGVTGKFIASIPFTIIFVLLAALFVALAIVPLFASVFLCSSKKTSTKFALKQERLTHTLQEWYRSKLRQIVGNKKRERLFRRSIALLLLISIILPFTGAIKAIFFAGEDSDYLFVDLEMQQGTSLLVTNVAAREVEAVLSDIPEVESFVTTVGTLSAFTSGTSGAKNANFTVLLKEKRKRSSTELQKELRQKVEPLLPNATVRVAELSSGPPVGDPVVVTFKGDGFTELNQAVTLAEGLLAEVPGSRDIDTSLQDDGIDFVINVNRAKVAEVGLDVATLAQVLRTSVFGVEATSIRTDVDDIDVMVRLGLNPNFVDINTNVQATLDQINYIPLGTPQGQVLLGSLIDVELAKANAIIEREDGRRIARVTSKLEDGFNPAEAVSEFRKMLEDADLPDGVDYSFGGEADETNQSFAELGLALIYGVILIMAILVLQFNSFRQTFIIVSVLPYILIGIFFGLMFTGQPISFPSIMGFIAVAGIAVNNSIILIDVMNSLQKQHRDWTPVKIAIEGGVQRLRPILLTTLTTVIGVVPLTYASALWAPLAWSIIFGLTFTVVLTLVLVPILYARRLTKNLAKQETLKENTTN